MDNSSTTTATIKPEKQQHQRPRCVEKIGKWKVFYDPRENMYQIKSKDLSELEDLLCLELDSIEKDYIQSQQLQRKQLLQTSATYLQTISKSNSAANLTEIQTKLNTISIEEPIIQSKMN